MRIQNALSVVDEETGAVYVLSVADKIALSAFLFPNVGDRQMVTAVKYVRARYPLSLKQAKDIVDCIRDAGSQNLMY